MNTVKGYNKIQSKNKIFGLEFIDLLFLAVIYLIVFVISSNLLINFPVILSAYWFFRIYKKGKPPHWPSSVIRFLIRPRKFSLRREMKGELS